MSREGIRPRLKLLIIGALGTVTYLAIQLFLPRLVKPSVLASKGYPAGPGWFVVLFQIHRSLFENPALQIFCVCILAFLLFRSRDRSEAGILAFLFGFGVPYVVFHLLGVL